VRRIYMRSIFLRKKDLYCYLRSIDANSWRRALK
jgi:hypothetical protein